MFLHYKHQAPPPSLRSPFHPQCWPFFLFFPLLFSHFPSSAQYGPGAERGRASTRTIRGVSVLPHDALFRRCSAVWSPCDVGMCVGWCRGVKGRWGCAGSKKRKKRKVLMQNE
jgi:hypothetical protein